jgi:DNA-3-methyladenine glycosylase II
MSSPETPVLPWTLEAHAHLLRADAPLASLAREYGPISRELTRDYFGRLVRAIVGQQISGKAAASIYGRLAERVDGAMAPESLDSLTDDEIRACGFSRNKLVSVRDLTARALDGRLDLGHLESLSDEEVSAQLIAVRGIGKWTADMFLMFALGRPDVLPAEDLGIQNAVERLYGLDAHPAPRIVKRLAEEGGWGPYRTAASFYLWDSLK